MSPVSIVLSLVSAPNHKLPDWTASCWAGHEYNSWWQFCLGRLSTISSYLPTAAKEISWPQARGMLEYMLHLVDILKGNTCQAKGTA